VYVPPGGERPRILPLKGVVMEVKGRPVEGNSLLVLLGGHGSE
jgi:hypothetical protein